MYKKYTLKLGNLEIKFENQCSKAVMLYRFNISRFQASQCIIVIVCGPGLLKGKRKAALRTVSRLPSFCLYVSFCSAPVEFFRDVCASPMESIPGVLKASQTRSYRSITEFHWNKDDHCPKKAFGKPSPAVF